MIFVDLHMFFMTKKYIRKSTFFDLGMSFVLEKSISKQTFCYLRMDCTNFYRQTRAEQKRENSFLPRLITRFVSVARS